MKKGNRKSTDNEIEQFIVEYLDTGSYNAVGKMHGKDHRSIMYSIEKYRINKPEQYNKLYQAYLQKSEEKFIQLTTSTINKAVEKIQERIEENDGNLSQLATAMGIMYDKRQLSQGKSTQNSAIVVQMSSDIQDLAN